MKWYTTNNMAQSVKLRDIPRVDYNVLRVDLCERLKDASYHVASYFAVAVSDEYFTLYVILLNDDTHQVLIASCVYEYYCDQPLQSMAAVHPQMHVFEREITEKHGIKFADSPWDKPLRFPVERFDKSSTPENYPFYRMQGESLHEVNVGPIHAGIIEPGVFRFICNGERILHLEIALGYQHRDIESLITATDSRLRQTALAESIAGDSAVAHAVAYTNVIEKFAATADQNSQDSRHTQDTQDTQHACDLYIERAVALELERMAMHIADVGALCMDIGYQLGQVACEATRTIVINTTQMWCGNRFGKGLIRPYGSYYPLTEDIITKIAANITTATNRYEKIVKNIKNTPSVLARFEECGVLNESQATAMGLVGVSARASGLSRDIRASHPYMVYTSMVDHRPIVREQGDVMARVMVRAREVEQSAGYILSLLEKISNKNPLALGKPIYDRANATDSMAFSLVEGWRGEICHVAITDSKGEIAHYKIKDPSMHNWMGLAIAVRGGGISDFPICNKSFNLSYCGHDL